MNELSALSTLSDELIRLFDREAQAQFDGSAIGEDAFAGLARRLFRLQTFLNPRYRPVVESTGLVSVDDWRRFPCVPTAAFRDSDWSCIPQQERTGAFVSSGTTRGLRSRHCHSRRSLALYRGSLYRWFFHHFRSPRNAQLMVLTPSPKDAPDSSLAYMFGAVSQAFEEADFYGRSSTDRVWELDRQRLVTDWNEARRRDRPVALLGTAFSFVWLLELRELPPLPAESLLLETGGYKGLVQEWRRSDLYDALISRFGLERNRLLSEYGMCELSSQAYDCRAGDSTEPRLFRFPPWARCQVISPETEQEVEMGVTGLIRVFDLANAWSVMAVQTGDLGRRLAGGVQLLGRASETELRGCSLRFEA